MKDSTASQSTGLIVTATAGDSEVTVVFHDAARGEASAWNEVRLFTSTTFPRETFAGRALTKRDYQDIGFNVVNRLCSLAGLQPSPRQSAPVRRPTRKRRPK